MLYWTVISFIVIGVLSVIYLYIKYRYLNYFNNKVIHMPPTPIFGVMAPILFRQTSFVDLLQKIYNYEPDAKYFGIYSFTEPVIFLRDLDLIKDIFINNFDTFPDREAFASVKDSLFSHNLFSLQGQKWREVRSLLSPAFASSKMKTMFTLMSNCAMDFTNSLLKISTHKSDMDMKDVFTKYTNDVIARCVFGTEINSLSDPTNRFYVYGKNASNFDGLRGYKLSFCSTFPWLTRVLGLTIISDEMTNFFKDVVKTTIDDRHAENITCPDMIPLMMDNRSRHVVERELSIEEMTAQAFVFFLNGFETTSVTMSFVAQIIAANPNVQEKLRQEIDNVLEDSNGEVTYEIINHLDYLHAVINETLRLYPPNVFLERVSVNDYNLPPALPSEESFIMKKGMRVWIPSCAIQRDDKYYDDPEEFRPERFLDNNVDHNSPCFLPFGLGPRMCIASRFAMLEIKVLLFHLLARCELTPCPKTILPIKLSASSFSLQPEGGFWLNVQRRSDIHSTILPATYDSNNF